jgi:hypothetical protein
MVVAVVVSLLVVVSTLDWCELWWLDVEAPDVMPPSTPGHISPLGMHTPSRSPDPGQHLPLPGHVPPALQ